MMRRVCWTELLTLAIMVHRGCWTELTDGSSYDTSCVLDGSD